MVEPQPPTPASGDPSRTPLWMMAVLCALVVGAYGNSINTPFQFDDLDSIVTNSSIRSLSTSLSPPQQIGTSGRPILNLTFALNYAISRLNVGSYHATNLVIHALAGVTLFGLIRRTLRLPRFGATFSGSAHWIAFIASALWLVHPLQTMCVTYIVQRAESLVSLFYLLTLYCSLRAATESRPLGWQFGAVAACAVGMATKEVMATAPLAVLIYDRVFLSHSFVSALYKRRTMYAGLGFCWVILASLVIGGPRSETAGFALKDWTPFEYAKTQPEVILHYLSLVFWPNPLVIDYDWPIASAAIKVLPAAAVILIMVYASARAVLRGSPAGFLGASFFLILSVTSSVIPINIIASEHRMYLALAPVILFVVMAVHRALLRLANAGAGPTAGRFVACILFVSATVALVAGTRHRNMDYASAYSLWGQALMHRPKNPRAMNSMGYVYSSAGKFAEAIPFYQKAIELWPVYVDAHFNLAEDLRRIGQHDDAAKEYEFVLQQSPRDAYAYAGLAGVFVAKGRLKDALECYERAISIRPDDPDILASMGVVLAAAGRFEDAVAKHRAALVLRPDDVALHAQFGSILAQMNRLSEAGDQFAEAVRLDPSNSAARYRLGLARLSSGRTAEAVVALRQSAQESPGNPDVHLAYGKALSAAGDAVGAVGEFRKSLELNPKLIEAQAELAWILATSPNDKLRNAEEAVRLAEEAARSTQEKNFAFLDTLGTAYANAGRFDDAIRVTSTALDLARTAKQSDAEAKIASRIALYRERRPFRSGT
ncbi:MAG: tetratricopeptide repeat protein [Planctomycetes bacterium]|nr:tetratricopeptide repeat protein [Planctomycetota bacterium]